MPIILPKSAEPADYNTNYILYWNSVGLDFNRLTHSLRTGPQGGPPISARVLCILHLAIHDAYFALKPPTPSTFKTYLEQFVPSKLPTRPPTATDPRNAVAAAAITVLQALYTKPDPKTASSTTFELSQFLQKAWEEFSGLDALSPSYRYGIAVGRNMLEAIGIKPDEPGVDQGAYRPKDGEYYFGPDLSHPTRVMPIDPNNPEGPKKSGPVYHGPFYGLTAKRIAVQYSSPHLIADPPTAATDNSEWEDSIRDVHRMGGPPGASTTKRSTHQQAAGLFWAYDGVNLIGTPPRLYNQIMRAVAWQQLKQDPYSEASNAEFARLFALANAAMADAGVISWQEKYHFEFWRPLTGVRQNTTDFVDPNWQSYGAPDTNSNGVSFKPPFPAYPSGHATFGAAFFQTLRLFYRDRDHLTFPVDGADCIKFTIVSDELNGISRELDSKYDPTLPLTDQPGLIRTKVTRTFDSLWEAMWENAISRVWLGVHWRFDAFGAEDVLCPTGDPCDPYEVDDNGATMYKPAKDVTYNAAGTRADHPAQPGQVAPTFPIGGVPLGIGIAADIMESKLIPTPQHLQPTSL